jgi:regulator of sirC expression with transglutaminase-like and TPR domain
VNVAANPTERFRELMARGENDVPLDEACLLIAAHARPGLDVEVYLNRLDQLAGGFLPPTLDGLLRHLFGPGRFAGNTETYYDPRNSYLDHVVDRRLGIPITLAIVAIEVGRRAGVPMSGVSMPGHFLLRDKVDPDVFADPFDGGRLLTAAQCRQLHRRLTNGAAWADEYLDPVSKRTIVARVLANLKGIAQQRGDVGMLHWVMRLRQCVPGVAELEADEFRKLLATTN